MFTTAEAFLLGAAAVLLLLGLVEVVARLNDSTFVGSVIMGQDKRISTSKTFVLMWTLLVAWALVSLLIPGQFIGGHHCLMASMQSPAMTCSALHDRVGQLQHSWQQFLSSGLSNSYLVLLGVPAVGAVGAKAITQTQANAGTIVKGPALKAPSLGTGLAQIFSGDDQTTDIGDFQYMIFNLIAAAFFIAEFLSIPKQGLPVIPDTLLGLTSVSAALYLGKKAASRNQPTITGVFPNILKAGTTFTIVGNGLDDKPHSPGADPPNVRGISINGVQVDAATVHLTVAGQITGVVPANLVGADQTAPVAGSVQVLTANGAITAAFAVQCARSD